MSEQQAKQPAKKRMIYTNFIDQQRANIRKYAAENGNTACLRKYRSEIPDLHVGKSTGRSFKKHYQHALTIVNPNVALLRMDSRKQASWELLKASCPW